MAADKRDAPAVRAHKHTRTSIYSECAQNSGKAASNSPDGNHNHPRSQIRPAARPIALHTFLHTVDPASSSSSASLNATAICDRVIFYRHPLALALLPPPPLPPATQHTAVGIQYGQRLVRVSAVPAPLSPRLPLLLLPQKRRRRRSKQQQRQLRRAQQETVFLYYSTHTHSICRYSYMLEEEEERELQEVEAERSAFIGDDVRV